ncbi:hypothetical protein HS088_TW05G00213 [Tripterygium wilfordii]|uniref:Uncharacterized protein n=1 Tax=Tripterygium wilfordii TaxID=458696 RepID=A0A7J7DM93_TRIWF|nr:uncharacterized protein LOC119999028 isoform X2 [Tripterygium wilfordii]KAF5747492.1 hypothetical protein HS088_TW05G00213 [Tripterygium wilfordii]
MAAESNTGFHRDEALGSALNRHAISFQSGAINSSSEMIPMGGYFGTTTGMMLPGNSSIINNSHGIVQAGNSSGSSSIFSDSVPGPGLAVEWSVQEQYKLDEGLVKYADEPSILKYIKIAATLPDKTVRDVALRCRWLKRKQRKTEDHNSVKKVNNRKDKLAESSSKMNIPSAFPQNVAAYSTMMHHVGQSDHMLFEGVSGTARHLLEKNAQALSQIIANLSTFKLQENIELFRHARNNITAILNDMREMPGIMSHMPPLPVSINEDLANSLLLNTSQSRSMMFGSPSGIQLKQEPRDGAYC